MVWRKCLKEVSLIVLFALFSTGGSVLFAASGDLVRNRIILPPITLDPQNPVRDEFKDKYTGSKQSIVRDFKMELGEGVRGQNYLRLIVNDKKWFFKGKKYNLTVIVRDGDKKTVYSRKHAEMEFLSSVTLRKEKKLPGAFQGIEDLKIQSRWSEYGLRKTHRELYLPYENLVNSFPGSVTVEFRSVADNAYLGAVFRKFPDFGYIRLHLARYRFFDDENSVPAFLRVWLGKEFIGKCKVRLQLVNVDIGKIVKSELLDEFTSRDSRFDLNIAGLDMGKYQLTADLLGIPGLKASSSVWFSKQSLLVKSKMKIPLIISELPGTSRKSAIAAGGIPLPDGVLAVSELNRCAVVDSKNRTIPAQFRVLATWAENKRFARWLLIDAVVDSRQGACGPYFLVKKKNTDRKNLSEKIKVINVNGGLVIDTGVLMARFSGGEKGGLTQLWYDENHDGRYSAKEKLMREGQNVVAYQVLAPTASTEKSFTTSSLNSGHLTVSLEERGSLRTVVRIEGSYGEKKENRKFNGYVLRFTFFAGKSEVEVENTFVCKMNPRKYLIRGYGLRWPVKAAAHIGLPNGKSFSTPFAVEQISENELAMNGKRENGRFGGTVFIGNKNNKSGYAVHMSDFWQQYPAGIKVDSEILDIQFWPVNGKPLDLRNSKETYYRGYAMGVAKTHKLLLRYGETPFNPSVLKKWDKSVSNPLRISVAPDRVLNSKAVGWLHPFDPNLFPEEEKALDNVFRGLQLQPDKTGVYGCMDWGDTHFQWDYNKKCWSSRRYWLNNETTGDDTTISLWMQYLRTGKREYFDYPARRTSHLMDVDTCHYSDNQPQFFDSSYPQNYIGLVGLQHRHADNHWSGACCVHHTSQADMIQYYHLTGRWRVMDVLKESTASFKGFRPIGHSGKGNLRNVSAPFRLISDLYWQFWDYDSWRMSIEMMDRLLSYSLPNRTAFYAYSRYFHITGDNRFGWELIKQRIISARVLPSLTNDDLRRMTSGEYMDPMITALFYEITRDRRFFSKQLALRNLGGKIPFCLSFPLQSKYPDNGKNRTPPGYGWRNMSIFKYAFLMEAFVRDGTLEKKKPKHIMATNGNGGGRWSKRKAFLEKRTPDSQVIIRVANGDTLVYDLNAKKANVAGIIIDKGATLVFAKGKRTLVCRGNIRIEQGGKLRMGPGSVLQIDSVLYNGQYSIVGSGMIEAIGSSSTSRDCRIEPFLKDGLHGFRIILTKATPGNSYGVLKHALLRDCFVTIEHAPLEMSDCEIKNCEISFSLVHKGLQKVSGNRIDDSKFKFYQTFNLLFEKNHFQNSGMYYHINGPGVGKVLNNTFDGMPSKGGYGIIYMVSTGKKSIFSGNIYRNARQAIFAPGERKYTFNNDSFYGNGVAVNLGEASAVFNNCSFGIPTPNTKADLKLSTAKAKAWLVNCKFAEKRKFDIFKNAGVLSLDHNGEKAERRVFGRELKLKPLSE